MFQFHTVQLKVAACAAPRIIPKFQFHTVQLKVRLVLFSFGSFRTFQFHTVQLKVVAVCRQRSAESRFNSIRFN